MLVGKILPDINLSSFRCKSPQVAAVTTCIYPPSFAYLDIKEMVINGKGYTD